MPSKPRALFIGRWQPFHNGHKHIIDEALKEGESVLIAVRDTELSESDPFTVEQRIRMIRGTYCDQDVEVMRIPDISSVRIGRKVGYDVVRYDVPEDVAGISATQIRAKREAGDDTWRDFVPAAVAEYLKKPIKVIWLTGRPAVGKTTIAKKLLERNPFPVHLDADVIRKMLWPELGYTPEDRKENVLRFAKLAKQVSGKLGTAIVSIISPYEAVRQEALRLIGREEVCLVHVTCDHETCLKRDPKGMYAKAIKGEIPNFTGVSAPYEIPENPDLTINTDEVAVDKAADLIVAAAWR